MMRYRDEMLLALAFVLAGAIVWLGGCGEIPHPVKDHPDELEALGIVGVSYEEDGIPFDVGGVSIVWLSGMCVLPGRLDTERWEFEQDCVSEITPACVMFISYAPVISGTPFAHGLMHCALFQHGRPTWFRHTDPEWQFVPKAVTRLMEAGL